MKKTAEEILEIIENADISTEDFAYGDFDSEELGLGEWKEVAKGGGEGKGSDWFTVKHFIEHDVYIRTDGFYASHYGTDFEEGIGREVKPVERVVTFYES